MVKLISPLIKEENMKKIFVLIFLLSSCITNYSLVEKNYIDIKADFSSNTKFHFENDNILKITHWGDMIGEWNIKRTYHRSGDTLFVSPSKKADYFSYEFDFRDTSAIYLFSINDKSFFSKEEKLDTVSSVDIDALKVNEKNLRKISRSVYALDSFKINNIDSILIKRPISTFDNLLYISSSNSSNYNSINIYEDNSKSYYDLEIPLRWLIKGNKLIPIDKSKKGLTMKRIQ